MNTPREKEEMTPDEKKFVVEFLKLRIQTSLTDIMILSEQYKEQSNRINQLLIDHPTSGMGEQQQLIEQINANATQYEAEIKRSIDDVTPAMTLSDIQYYAKRCRSLKKKLETGIGDSLEALFLSIDWQVQAQIACDPMESQLSVSPDELSLNTSD